MNSSVVAFMVNVSEVLNKVNSHVGNVYVANVMSVTAVSCRKYMELYIVEKRNQTVDHIAATWVRAAIVAVIVAVVVVAVDMLVRMPSDELMRALDDEVMTSSMVIPRVELS